MSNNPFGQNKNPFGGNQGNTNSNPFANNQTQTGGNPFAQIQGAQSNNSSGQNQQGQQIFNQGQTQQGGNPFSQGGNNPFSQNQGGQNNNPFNQNQTQTGNPFNQNQGQQGNIFNQNQGQGGNIYTQNQQQQGNQLFPQNQQQNNPFSQNSGQVTGGILPNLQQDALAYSHQLESIKNQLLQCLNRLNVHSLDYMRVEPTNVHRDQHINKLPVKNECIEIMKNFKELKKRIQILRKKNDEIEKKSINYIKQTHKKLTLYKECLLQTTSQTKLINEVNSQVNMMNQQIQQFFKPLYNSYKMKKPITLKDPDQFTLKISFQILNKMNILNQRIDDLQACQNQDDEETCDTIAVFQQLLQYYQNVSCNFKQFLGKYNTMKKLAIQKQRRGSYDGTMSRIQEKVTQNLNKQFKYYDLIKQVDQILQKRQKRQERKKYEDRESLRNFQY